MRRGALYGRQAAFTLTRTYADYAAEQEEEVCALQAILMDDIQGRFVLCCVFWRR